MPNRDWAELSPGMKEVYRNQGVTAATYNKWWRMSQTERTDLSVAARAAGYRSGLNFLAVQSAVKTKSKSRKTITVLTKPSTAATMLITKMRGAEGQRNRTLVAHLFQFDEFEQGQWENFMSP